MSNTREVVEGLPESVNPLEYGGAVGNPKRYKTEEEVNGNVCLTGRTFYSSCSLPDVQPNSKIIGICGVPDDDMTNQAHPEQDGWFFSDFFLMHHLFKNVSSDQVWWACAMPEDLLKKYGPYIHHGADSSAESRRVVLDRTMLEQVKDIKVVTPEDLANCAMKSIKDARIDAQNQNRSLLVLIFTHGSMDQKLVLGRGEHMNVTMARFKEALGAKPLRHGACLVTSACFSGGYAIADNLNITALTAQSAWAESLAWPVSGSYRSYGSPFISAIASKLLNLHIDGFGTIDQDDFQRSPTYAGITKAIRDEIHRIHQVGSTNEDGILIQGHQPMFSAQGDEWEMEYGKRTGIPLNSLRSQWLLLKAAGERPSPPGGEHRFSPGPKIFSYDQLLEAVAREGKEYLGSFPGFDNRAKNLGLHNTIRKLLRGHEFSPPNITMLTNAREAIFYRLFQVMQVATLYKKYLGVDMADCHLVDTDNFRPVTHPYWPQTLMFVFGYTLFDEPSEEQGHEYIKGYQYLAGIIITQNWDRKVATEKLDSLVKYRDSKVRGSGVVNVPRASGLMDTIRRYELDRNPTIRGLIRDFANSTKRRMRSLSPKKISTQHSF